jgi:hypothetical protein
MYDIMVRELKAGNVDAFICAGGTMSHYVGDACQCLHISYKHHGIKKEDSGVHGDYEDKMLTNKNNRKKLFDGINGFNKKVLAMNLFKGGQGAAIATLQLMRDTFNNLKPDKVIKAWRKAANMEELFAKVGDGTIENINRGCLTMAIIWQSAWIEGNGKQIAQNALTAIDTERLTELYEDKSFVPSFNLDKLVLKKPEFA